jgi:hypothetical protein
MDHAQSDAFARHMLGFVRKTWPSLEVAALEVGGDEKNDVLWCKLHRTEEARTHGGGYLFTVAYLERSVEP